MGLIIGNYIGIGRNSGGSVNWATWWASLISATVENSAPTDVVLTFPVAQPTLTDADFTVAGYTIVSGSWTGAVFTLVLSEDILIFDGNLTITFKLTNTATVINNVADDGNSRGYYTPTLAAAITKDGSNRESIYWDMRIGKNVWGATVATGNTVVFAVYKIITCEANYFYNGNAVGDIFVCPAVKAMNANNSLQRATGNHLTQYDTAKMPVNGVFDGTDDYMKVPAFTFNQPENIYMVVRQIAGWVNGDQIWCGNGGGSGDLVNIGAVAPGVRVYAGAGSGTTLHLRLNKWSVVRVIFNGANSKLQINKVPAITGNFGAANMGGFVLAARTDGAYTTNIETKEIILRAADDSDELEDAIYAKLKRKYGLKNISIIGDSIIAAYLTYTRVCNLMAYNKGVTDVSDPGDTIADQKTLWEAAADSELDCTLVQVGANDLAGADEVATIITIYQTLITAIRAVVGTNKIIGCTVSPCKAWLGVKYSKWVALNEAIRGNGATPITNLDGYIDIAATALNDGADNLAAAYDSGDHVHPNDAGRQIIADAWDVKLVELGIV